MDVWGSGVACVKCRAIPSASIPARIQRKLSVPEAT